VSWQLEEVTGEALAHEMEGYILTDRGTFLSRRNTLALDILVEGDEQLMNPYAIIGVHPARFPDINASGAQRLIEWMASSRGQALIEGYRVNGYQLFHPLVEGAGG